MSQAQQARLADLDLIKSLVANLPVSPYQELIRKHLNSYSESCESTIDLLTGELNDMRRPAEHSPGPQTDDVLCSGCPGGCVPVLKADLAPKIDLSEMGLDKLDLRDEPPPNPPEDEDTILIPMMELLGKAQSDDAYVAQKQNVIRAALSVDYDNNYKTLVWVNVNNEVCVMDWTDHEMTDPIHLPINSGDSVMYGMPRGKGIPRTSPYVEGTPGLIPMLRTRAGLYGDYAHGPALEVRVELQQFDYTQPDTLSHKWTLQPITENPLVRPHSIHVRMPNGKVFATDLLVFCWGDLK